MPEIDSSEEWAADARGVIHAAVQEWNSKHSDDLFSVKWTVSRDSESRLQGQLTYDGIVAEISFYEPFEWNPTYVEFTSRFTEMPLPTEAKKLFRSLQSIFLSQGCVPSMRLEEKEIVIGGVTRFVPIDSISGTNAELANIMRSLTWASAQFCRHMEM